MLNDLGEKVQQLRDDSNTSHLLRLAMQQASDYLEKFKAKNAEAANAHTAANGATLSPEAEIAKQLDRDAKLLKDEFIKSVANVQALIKQREKENEQEERERLEEERRVRRKKQEEEARKAVRASPISDGVLTYYEIEGQSFDGDDFVEDLGDLKKLRELTDPIMEQNVFKRLLRLFDLHDNTGGNFSISVKSRSLARYEIAPITMTADYTFIITPHLELYGFGGESETDGDIYYCGMYKPGSRAIGIKTLMSPPDIDLSDSSSSDESDSVGYNSSSQQYV